MMLHCPRTFWATFDGAPPTCIDALDEAMARAIAERWAAEQAFQGRVAKLATLRTLPYPASPRIGLRSTHPSFCLTPEDCQGRAACPRDRACND